MNPLERPSSLLAGAALERMPAPNFEQAKNPAGTPRFVPIVAKPEGAAEPKLTRVAFKISRLMEFCSERELVNQTGHSVWDWPTVAVKELIDNALDACEEAEVAPKIAVTVEKDAITVQDNAGGIGAETMNSVLDYTIRVSSREAYVSPTRGAQGNALKTILAMGYVLDRENDGDRAGVTIIEAHGLEHRIEFRVDHVNNQPRIVHTTTPSPLMVGTKIHHSLAGATPARLRGEPVKAARPRLRLAQPASYDAWGLVRPGLPRRAGDQSRLGEVATAQSDQRPLV